MRAVTLDSKFEEVSGKAPIGASLTIVGEGDCDKVRLDTVCRIGSGSDADVVVNCPRVSQQHCRIEWRDICWCLLPIHEDSVVFLNGRRIRNKATLCDGDLIEIGSCRLEFSVSQAATDDTISFPFMNLDSRQIILQSGIGLKVRQQFDLSANADLGNRIACVLRYVLSSTNANLGCVRLPRSNYSHPLIPSSLTTVSGISLRQTPWVEPDQQLSEQAISSRTAVYCRERQIDSAYIPLVTGCSTIGLLHLISVNQPQVRLVESKQFCQLVCEILGLLIGMHQSRDAMATIRCNADDAVHVVPDAIENLCDLFNATNWKSSRHSIVRAIRSKRPLFISGNPGSGRMRIARTIAQTTSLSQSSFVKVDCSEPKTCSLLRSAFSKTLMLEGPSGSPTCNTYVLHNVATLSLAAQRKLESVLEDTLNDSRASRKLQLISIVNSEFDENVQNGHVRTKLASLLGVHRVYVPRLSERKSEIPRLIDNLLRSCTELFGIKAPILTNEALEACIAYGWPGNWEELAKTIRAASLTCSSHTITKADLPFVNHLPGAEVFQSLAEVEELHVQRVLDATNGNKTEASRLLGIDRSTLNRKLRSFKAGSGSFR